MRCVLQEMLRRGLQTARRMRLVAGAAALVVGASAFAMNNRTVRLQGTGATPAPLTDEAKMYSSRQQALFNPKVQAGNEKETGIKIDSVHMLSVPHLSEQFPDLKTYDNKVARTKLKAPPDQKPEEWYNQIITDDEVVLLDIVRRKGLSPGAKGFVRAGPRGKVVWAPGEVKAAIVTCGGLCPGLNDVVEELATVLYYNYGVDEIYGIPYGYRGFHEKEYQPWMNMTPSAVAGISHKGGTVLGASRGGFDKDKIMEACEKKGINQLYIVGGDGTHRAADALYQEAKKRKLKMAIAGVPKTIDNDIGTIDYSFGFNTAVDEARKAINSAVVESQCTPSGIGIVKLMGRHAGYISAHATLASRQVDLCLIPEVEFPMQGSKGVLEYMERLIDLQGHAVIVVAEGAGEHLVGTDGGTDESGNKQLPDIGKYLQKELTNHFKTKGKNVSLKYHDPSYMIRSVPANAADSVYCDVLAQNAVHGAMAGFTGFTSAQVNNRTVYLPFSTVIATSPSYLNPWGRTWERVVSSTMQPNWIAPKGGAAAESKPAAAAAPAAAKKS